jgi:thymidine kinase
MNVDVNNYDVILIEEAQWFDDLVEFIELNRNSPCRFYVFGLVGDINRNKFGHIADIIHLASNITMFHGVCEFCGDDSSFTKRKGDIKERDVPGGDELYYTVCYKHVCSETK